MSDQSDGVKEVIADAKLGRTLRALLLGDDTSKDAPIEVAFEDATSFVGIVNVSASPGMTVRSRRLYDFISSIRAALHEGEDPAAEQIAAEDHI